MLSDEPSLSDYIDAMFSKLGGVARVAGRLNVTRRSVRDYRDGSMIPTDEVFLKIADEIGVPRDRALVDLNIIRARRDGSVEREAVYTGIRKRLIERAASVALAIGVGGACIGAPSPAPAAFSEYRDSVYYGTRRGRRVNEWPGRRAAAVA